MKRKSDPGPVRQEDGSNWVESERTAYPHFYTFRMANTAFSRATTEGAQEAGDDFQLVAVLVAFTAEAYFNLAGSRLMPYGSSIDSIPVGQKAEVLNHHVFKRPVDWGVRPYQSLGAALNYGNGTAHGKPETIRWQGLVSKKEKFLIPGPDWEACRTRDVAERLLEDVKKLILELHTAAGFSGDPFATSGDSSTVVHLIITNKKGEPDHERGRRTIDAAKAEIIKRIFASYNSGVSPEEITKQLNAEKIPGPSGREWNPSTISGNPDRGTGILNNDNYRGVRIWNRLRYVKNPKTGKRVSRPNPPELWERADVPELRIVDDITWDACKARQAKLRRAIGGAPGWRPVKARDGRCICSPS
jgi:Recombinase